MKKEVVTGLCSIVAAIIGAFLGFFLSQNSIVKNTVEALSGYFDVVNNEISYKDAMQMIYEDQMRLKNDIEDKSSQLSILQVSNSSLQGKYEELLPKYEKALQDIASLKRQNSTPTISVIDDNYHPTDYHSSGFSGDVTFDYSGNNGQYTIGTGEYEFTTDWSKASNTAIHADNDPSNIRFIARWKEDASIDELPIIEELDFTSRTRTADIGDAIVWINNNGYIAVTRIVSIKDDSRGDPYDELTFEYYIFP